LSKLLKSHQFIDLSDYGRPLARVISRSLKNTSFTPIHVTLSFIVSGIIAIIYILNGYYTAASFFLILKSILDAADGELARIKATPSYIGRYLDSIADIILNLFIFLALWYITGANIIHAFLAFVGLQLQGTLYNYYYVILRNNHKGDTTSRIFENSIPKALGSEKQSTVNVMYRTYKICYGLFDKAIYLMDRTAPKGHNFPNWLMTAVSTFGLGFQLLIISIMLVLGLKDFIIPFFIGYSVLIFVFIGIRKGL